MKNTSTIGVIGGPDGPTVLYHNGEARELPACPTLFRLGQLLYIHRRLILGASLAAVCVTAFLRLARLSRGRR